MWDKNYLFIPKLERFHVKVWECIINFIPRFTSMCYFSMLGLQPNYVNKSGPRDYEDHVN